jgi:hypothetical protein
MSFREYLLLNGGRSFTQKEFKQYWEYLNKGGDYYKDRY